MNCICKPGAINWECHTHGYLNDEKIDTEGRLKALEILSKPKLDKEFIKKIKGVK